MSETRALPVSHEREQASCIGCDGPNRGGCRFNRQVPALSLMSNSGVLDNPEHGTVPCKRLRSPLKRQLSHLRLNPN
jgi:hypothetical protein